MTKKDYILFAKVINDNTIPKRNLVKRYALINDLCVVFKVDNPLFNGAKFRNACGDNSSNRKVD